MRTFAARDYHWLTQPDLERCYHVAWHSPREATDLAARLIEIRKQGLTPSPDPSQRMLARRVQRWFRRKFMRTRTVAWPVF